MSADHLSNGLSGRFAASIWIVWSAHDLERKLALFKDNYNTARVHQGLAGDTPEEKAGGPTPQAADLQNYRWQSHCHGVFELPNAA